MSTMCRASLAFRRRSFVPFRLGQVTLTSVMKRRRMFGIYFNHTRKVLFHEPQAIAPDDLHHC